MKFKAAPQLVTSFLPFCCFGCIKPISFYYKSEKNFGHQLAPAEKSLFQTLS